MNLVFSRVERFPPDFCPQRTGLKFIEMDLARQKTLSVDQIEDLPQKVDEQICPIRTLDGEMPFRHRCDLFEIGGQCDQGQSGMDKKRFFRFTENLNAQVCRMIEETKGFFHLGYRRLK